MFSPEQSSPSPEQTEQLQTELLDLLRKGATLIDSLEEDNDTLAQLTETGPVADTLGQLADEYMGLSDAEREGMDEQDYLLYLLDTGAAVLPSEVIEAIKRNNELDAEVEKTAVRIEKIVEELHLTEEQISQFIERV